MTWSIRIGDLQGETHTMVSAEMPGLWCRCKERGYVAEKN